MSHFGCVHCGRQYRWKPQLAGKRIKCKCGQRIVAPQRAEARPVAAAHPTAGVQSAAAPPPLPTAGGASDALSWDSLPSLPDDSPLARPRRSMPASVMIAVMALIVAISGRTLMIIMALIDGSATATYGFIGAGVGVLVIVGLISGHRLAWQWGTLLAAIAAVLMAIAFAFAIRLYADGEIELLALALMTTQALPLFAIPVVLQMKEAKRFFSLECPECGYVTSRSANFFFTKAKCKVCGCVW